IRPSLKRSVYKDCPDCNGAALVKTAESMAIEVMRLLMLASQHADIAKINVTVCDEVATYLNNKKRREMARLEDEGQMTVQIYSGEGATSEHLSMECQDAEGREVKFPL